MKQTTCFDFMGRSIRIIRRPPRRAPVAASFSLPPPFGHSSSGAPCGGSTVMTEPGVGSVDLLLAPVSYTHLTLPTTFGG